MRASTNRPGTRRRYTAVVAAGAAGLLAAGCGGGTGTPQDSGADKTTLTVQAADADGDALHYQWRATAGTIENRDAPQTVWTLPPGPGLHFAYVVVSDGRGGYVEQQYAVSSDALGTDAPARPTVARAAPARSTNAWSAGRIRFALTDDRLVFAASAGGTAGQRHVYLPDVQMQLDRCSDAICSSTSATVYSATSDLSGEIALPALESGAYRMRCSTVAGAPMTDCAAGILTIAPNVPVGVRVVTPPLGAQRNLRLYGHVALTDGTACGTTSEYFALRTAATVQLLAADGSALAPAVRVNRFGDYAIDAAVFATGRYQLKVSCEGDVRTLAVPAATGAYGYGAAAPVELSHVVANRAPTIARMVANGPDGNLRGQMIVPLPGTSEALPGWRQFLAYKGADDRTSACKYYEAIGAVGGCDAQGGYTAPITLDDWQRQKRFKPYDAGNVEVAANYVNRMDLNLVRRMRATRNAADDIAFVVCNHPGPDGASQAEIDDRIHAGLDGFRQIACVAMEWSTSPGVNGGLPFTKFLTFGPDGALLPSINLDGRGEKFMPGACVACHAGTQYNGRFPSNGSPSPFLGSAFLPFDTGNYLFASDGGLTEAAQAQAIRDLNQLVKATDAYSTNRSVARLVDGWYPNGTTTTLDKSYVPAEWHRLEVGDGVTAMPGVEKIYREVVGGVCRTCHVAMGTDVDRFNWDRNPGLVLNNALTTTHFCGGTADLANNASMPNALASRDRLADRIAADPELATLMQKYLGCVAPKADPAYARR